MTDEEIRGYLLSLSEQDGKILEQVTQMIDLMKMITERIEKLERKI